MLWNYWYEQIQITDRVTKDAGHCDIANNDYAIMLEQQYIEGEWRPY